MGNQISETHDRFNNASGVRQKYHFDDTAGLGLPRNFNLHDHHVEGPSKVMFYYLLSPTKICHVYILVSFLLFFFVFVFVLCNCVAYFVLCLVNYHNLLNVYLYLIWVCKFKLCEFLSLTTSLTLMKLSGLIVSFMLARVTALIFFF